MHFSLLVLASAHARMLEAAPGKAESQRVLALLQEHNIGDVLATRFETDLIVGLPAKQWASDGEAMAKRRYSERWRSDGEAAIQSPSTDRCASAAS